MDKLDRRKFLTNVGMFTAGAAAAATGIGVATPDNAHSAEEPAQSTWPYVTLDIEDVRKRGHLGYYQAECAQGAFSAIVGSLQEKIGAPYTGVPLHLLAYGGGGVAGWCTLCGAVNGACAAISLVAAKDDVKPLCDEMLKWYTQTAFPTDISNEYATKHLYLVDKYKSDLALPKSVPNSPLCHVNVSRWCKAHGYASGSSERSERCARITGDVAAFAVDMLNHLHMAKFEGKLAYGGEVDSCRACHKKGKDFAAGQWTRGKMECSGCHGLDTAKLVGPGHPES